MRPKMPYSHSLYWVFQRSFEKMTINKGQNGVQFGKTDSGNSEIVSKNLCKIFPVKKAMSSHACYNWSENLAES